MQFNSLQFAALLVIVLPIAWSLRGRQRHLLLLGASYFFYGSWDWRFLGLILLSTVIDFTVSRRIEEASDRRVAKRYMQASVAANLGILGIFKYLGFFVDSAEVFFEPIGLTADSAVVQFGLPAGISFYTFQTMSYTIDVWRGKRGAERDPIVFALFVAYFPQLVAGPIERSTFLLPQLRESAGRPSRERLLGGCGLIAEGLFRKVVIADLAAPLAARAFNDPDPGTIAILASLFAFLLQVYGDFAGYSLIARGTSRLLGVELSHNFRQPLLSRSMTEFWRRWHITLGLWLRDYLFIPLGGSRGGPWFVARNQLITMSLAGLWHGAAWTYVLWGSVLGLYIVLERTPLRPVVDHDEPLRVVHLPLVALTIFQMMLTFLFFRADDLGHTWRLAGALFTPKSSDIRVELLLLPILAAMSYAVDLAERHVSAPRLVRDRTGVLGVSVGVFAALVVVASGGEIIPFVYFQF